MIDSADSWFDFGRAGPAVDTVILVGGEGGRLGGADKGALLIGGVPLLDRVLAATAGAARTVVVGPPRRTSRPVIWTREDPPGGGPLPGLAAGIAALDQSMILDGENRRTPAPSAGRSDPPPAEVAPAGPAPSSVVLVLAADLPWFGASDVGRLVEPLADPALDAVLFTDASGRSQPLTAAYRLGPLRAALARIPKLSGGRVRLILDRLTVATVPDRGASGDCDTPEQLQAARAHFDRP